MVLLSKLSQCNVCLKHFTPGLIITSQVAAKEEPNLLVSSDDDETGGEVAKVDVSYCVLCLLSLLIHHPLLIAKYILCIIQNNSLCYPVFYSKIWVRRQVLLKVLRSIKALSICLMI